MSASPVSAGSPAPAAKLQPPTTDTDKAVPRRGASWQNYLTPVFVVLLVLAVLSPSCVTGMPGKATRLNK